MIIFVVFSVVCSLKKGMTVVVDGYSACLFSFIIIPCKHAQGLILVRHQFSSMHSGWNRPGRRNSNLNLQEAMGIPNSRRSYKELE